jgi:hypothetical protein
VSRRGFGGPSESAGPAPAVTADTVVATGSRRSRCDHGVPVRSRPITAVTARSRCAHRDPGWSRRSCRGHGAHPSPWSRRARCGHGAITARIGHGAVTVWSRPPRNRLGLVPPVTPVMVSGGRDRLGGRAGRAGARCCACWNCGAVSVTERGWPSCAARRWPLQRVEWCVAAR